MANGYVRQSSSTIAAGQPGASAPLSNEFNTLAAAFSGATGHDHSGGTGLGPSLLSSAFGVSTGSQGIIIALGGSGSPAGAMTVTTIAGTSNQITVTNGNGVAGNPTIAISGTYVGQSSITTLGTIATGTWQGTIVSPVYGGTGVNNGTFTTTLGGNLNTGGTTTFAGAFPVTFNFGAGTNLTFPSSGTVATTSGGGSTTITVVGTITTGTWNATKIALAFGGTNTDLSATGGTSNVLVQATVGGNITVRQLAVTDLSTSATGTGNIVLASSPTIASPTLTGTSTLGAANATSINKVVLTAPASAATLTIANNKTLTCNNTMTIGGTDSTTITFQGTDTYVGRATTDTLTNKTFDTAGTGNSFSINGVAATTNTGTGAVARAAAPTFTGTATFSVISVSSTSSFTGTLTAGTIAATTFSGTPNFSGAATGTTAATNDSSTKLSTTAFANPAATVGTTAGSVMLPSGLTLKYGTVAGVNGTLTVTYPVAFSTATVHVNGIGDGTNGVGDGSTVVTALSNTGFTLVFGNGVTITARWFAIGF